MYKFFKPKSATPGQSPQSPPQHFNHSPDQKSGGTAASAGSSPGTSLKHPLEPLQNDPRMEEVLMDQINALKKTIQDKEFEHTRRVETLIEALSDKAEENIQILNELEAVKEKMREMVAAEEERAAAAAAAAATPAENDGNSGAQIFSPQLPAAGEPAPLPKPAELSLSKSGDNAGGEHEVTLEKLKKELEEERKKTKKLESSIKDYEKKIASLEVKLKDKPKKKHLRKLQGDAAAEDNADAGKEAPTYEFEDSESEKWIVVCETGENNITNNNSNDNAKN